VSPSKTGASKGSSDPAESSKEKPGEDELVANLERKAHGRSVPKGLKIGGYIQAQYQTSGLSEDQIQQGGAPINQDRFLVRRGRIRFDHGWDWASASLELDANTVRGVNVGIRRAEGALLYRGSDDDQAPPLVALSIGVMDIPFGHELAESARSRHFMERSLGSLALFPTEPDVGAKVAGAVSFLRYGVAVMNGEPLDDSGFPRDPNKAKDIIGRVGVEVPATGALTVFGGSSFAKGTGFHPGQEARKDTLVWRDLDENGTVSGLSEISSIPGAAASPSENYQRWALGLDVGASLQTSLGVSKLYAEGFLASNYDRGFAPADPVVTGIDVRHTGGYVAALQDITKYGLVGFRAGFYDPNADVLESTGGRILPRTQTVVTLSPLVGFVLRDRAKLLAQYDFVLDHLGRDASGVPADAKNDQFTLRLQVEL